MKTVVIAGLVLVGLLAGPMLTLHAKEKNERKIPLSEVPKIIIDAAKKAVKGIELKEAEIEEENNTKIYELEGVANDKEYEVEIDEKGTVLDVEIDDDDDHDDHKKDRNDSKHYRKRYLAPVDNPTYKEECGACHFVYQPALLPSGSWEKILAGLEDHFGEGLELDPESKKIIAEYLKANAAERSSAKRAVKIMRTLGNRTPLRITQIPYIQEKHHEVSPGVLKRKSIGSLSNCSACHTTSEKGIYEDDYVVIPQ